MASTPDFEMSEQDLLFNAYVDGDLRGQERELFDERLERDEDFRSQYENFAHVVDSVRGLPFEFAPDDFVDKVQRRIRTRSRGRFFTDNILTRARVPYEVVAMVMIIAMAAIYLLMEVPPDANIDDVDAARGAPTQPLQD